MKPRLEPIENAPLFLVQTIEDKLKAGNKVLWFVTGGSSIKIASEVSKKLSENLDNLTIMMTDERYGDVGHKDSNWQGLLSEGFEIPDARLIPILDGNTIEKTTENFSQKISEEIQKADYKIGLFGAGADGHTAGILPESPTIDANNFATFYHTLEFDRITMTFQAIKELDEAVLCMYGKKKWPVIKDLLEKEIEIKNQPVQILKTLSKLIIFSDYKYE